MRSAKAKRKTIIRALATFCVARLDQIPFRSAYRHSEFKGENHPSCRLSRVLE